MGGSASCTRVCSPNQVTMPSSPSVKSPPSGITAQTRKAGTKARYGASLNTNRSALSGSRSSLKNSLTPSARVCRVPNGPALFGPTRFCMPAMILRSNHTMNNVLTRPTTKITATLSRTMISGVHRRSPISSGSRRDHIRSTLTSLAGARASTMSAIDAPGRLNGTSSEPRGTARSAASGSTTLPRAPITCTSVPSATPSPARSNGLTWRRARRRQPGQGRRHRRAHRPVVQLAAHHEAVVVAVAVEGTGRRRLRPLDRAVGGRQREHAVGLLVQRLPGRAGVRRHAGGDGVGDRVERGELVGDVVMAESLGELGGDHPVRPRGAGDRHLLGHGGHATLEVGGRAGLLTEGGGGEHDVGPAGRPGEKRVHGDHPAGAREGPAGEIGIGAVGDRVDAEQDEQVRATVGGRFEDAEPVGALTAGGQPELEGADDVAPAEGRQHLGVGAGIEHGSQGGHRRPGRLRQVGPAGDDHHRSGSELLLHRGVGEGGPEPGPGTGLDAAHCARRSGSVRSRWDRARGSGCAAARRRGADAGRGRGAPP